MSGTHVAVPDDRNRDVVVYVNGEWLPRDRAVISVFDSAFLVGDGVWEGVRLHDGVFAWLDLHLDRLFATADAEPGDLYTQGDTAFEFERTVSRLMEMQAEDYLNSRHIT